ncbi:hypothetical protein CMUS01_14939 [Colletotrichum musicola]|uniref:Aminoglycoside phosphotransferase domain-containing protein n=1 Tax=Colletotrichum musicola TaxID=2175873 RepID=A0A8H6J0B6_9PEZI|nr:hypothetical protein CMUS01_14939 [Colletotrichum musicola]
MTEPEPINAGRLARALTLTAYWLKTHQPDWTRSKKSVGLYSPFCFCFKARHGNLAEAHAMRRVAERTNIVMSKIDGQMVLYGWRKRFEASRRRILDQLSDMVAQIRTIKPAENVGVANAVGGPVYDCRFPDEKHLGPCATVQDLHKKLLGFDNLIARAAGELSELNEVLDFYGDYYEDPVFTHGDLSSLNILVRGDDVVGIIDWETAGWSPPYWEYTSAWFVNPCNPFWQEEVEKFLSPAPNEPRMETIRRKFFLCS